jgi:type I restriction enzyme S subunit
VTRRRTAPVDDILNLAFDIAPVPYQIAASALLTTIDDKIELNAQKNVTLGALAQALFRSWYVDFDPVVAKSEGRKPDGMDAETAKMFPALFDETEIGRVPKGWRAGRFGDVADCRRNIAGVGDFSPETAYIGLEHMPRNNIALTEWGSAAAVESAKARFSRGDVLFGKLRPYFHKVGIAPVDGVCSTDILVVVPRKAEYSALVLGYASSSELVDYADGCSTGTRMPRVSWSDLSRYRIPVPPPELARQLANTLAPVFNAIIENVHQTRLLLSWREKLLPSLLSGGIALFVPKVA